MTTIISIVLAIIVFNVVAVIVLKRRNKPDGNTSGTVAEKPAGNSSGTVAKPDGNTSGTGTAAGACVVELPGRTNDVLYQQVCFSDDVCGQWVSAYYCSDVAGGEYTLQTDGDLLVKLKLLCGKGDLKRENFTLSIDDHGAVTPTKMYDSKLYQKSVIEFDKEKEEEVVLYFEKSFEVLGRQFERANKNASWSVDLKYMGRDLFACDLYAMKGDGGWVAR